jgi:uncharacterized repeat protein (TIGR01451 family)
MHRTSHEVPGRGRRGRTRGALASLVVVAIMMPLGLFAMSGVASAAQFCNTSAITLNDRVSGQPPSGATPYPSVLAVSGTVGTISDVNLIFDGITTARTEDLDILLQAPGGQNLLAVSDTGGLNPVTGYDLTLDDAAASALPDSTTWPGSAGTFKPVDYDATADEAFPAPAPAPSGATTFATFNGGNANGNWNLWIVDDSLGGGAGTISGGWCLDITTNAAAAPTTTTLTSSQNPSFTGDPVTFTATVTSSGVPVPTGTVTFTIDGATVGTVAVDPAGQAQFTTSSLTEGAHQVMATYNGTAAFATSNASIVQVVNNHTVVTGNQFCNPGAITINSAASANQPATPYPSRVFVTGLPGTVTDVNVTLKTVSHTNPDDIDVLLVGPGGQNLIVLSDAGGSTAVSNFTVTFDDEAGAPLPDTGGWGSTPATVQVSSYAPADTFPAPAPAPSAATALSTFDTTAPNGTWELYVVDDSIGTGGSIANGWCLDFTTGGTPDLAVSLSHSPEPVTINEQLTQTITVTNNGTGAAHNAHLSETLPASWTFVSLTNTGGTAADSCTTPVAGASGTVSCDWASFAGGGTSTYQLVVRPKQTGSFTPTAAVSMDEVDPTPADNSDGDPTTVSTNGRGCTLVGTMGPDTLNGTAGPDVICGLGGADQENGMGGADVLYGQAGGDTLTDTAGIDRLMGGPANDSLNSQDGAGGDTVNGGRGVNTCSTDPGDIRKNC